MAVIYIPTTNPPDDLTGAILDSDADTGTMSEGLSNGTPYRPYALSAAGPEFTPTALPAGGISVVASAGHTVPGNNYAAYSVPLPTSIEDDYVLFAWASDDAMSAGAASSGTGPTFDDTQGWTIEALALQGANPGMILAWKKMGPTPDTTVNVFGSFSKATSAAVMVIRGAHPTQFLDVAIATASSLTEALPNPPSIQTATDNAMVVAVGMLDDDGVQMGAPAGFENLIAWGEGGENSNGAAVAMATQIVPTAGTTVDPGAFTHGSAADQWVAVTMALKPA